MKPFYYFCDEVEEYFDMRTLDNRNSGLEDTPNEWVHHNAESVTGKDYSELTEQQQNDVNGVLDYSEWIPPPYTEKYKTDEFKFEKPVIVVNNNYNIEYGKPITESLRFFDIKTLYDIFSYLTENGYTVVYKRPDNTEFTLDQNEMSTLDSKLLLTADVAGVGIISDYDLCEYFDGNVINNNNKRSWQKIIGYVPQQIYLSDDSIRANIAFGIAKENINQEAVEQAAKIANLHEFVIKELDNQYNTTVGERGIRLSGGQRQRIGIARALYHKPKVMIFDEATSALDNITEKVVMESIYNLESDVTVILITHRMNTVKKFDKILLLEKGSLKAQGTFEELNKKNIIFKKMTGAIK